MKHLTASTIAFALAFFSGVSLANPVPCVGCVMLVDKETNSSEVANLSLEKAVVDFSQTPVALTGATITQDPDCPGCVVVTTNTSLDVHLITPASPTVAAAGSTNCAGCVV